MITNVNPEIFRQYDIRGIFNKDLTAEVAQAIGAAYGIYLNSKLKVGAGLKPAPTVSVGRDVRLSSNTLRDALIQGIVSTGIDVIDIGECPTPLQYFSIYHLNLNGGIMITGSHNPPEFNGFKITVGRETIYGEEIQEIRRIIEQGQGPAPAGFKQGARGKGQGKTENYDIVPAYIDYLKKQFLKSNKHAVKIVVDAGNGTAGRIAPAILRAIGCDVTELFCEPDGNFPNHHPDPTIPENLKDLAKTVKAQKADFGIAYDGDADRIGVVDENGAIIWGDQLMIIFARNILNQKSEEKPAFVGEVKCSQVMYDEIKKLGGNAIMWKTGHSLIKSKMKETGAVLAGEMSGHMFFADRYFGYDDAIYASCRLAEILSQHRYKEPAVRFSSLLSGLQKTYTTPEIRVDCPDDKKFGVIERLSETIDLKQENIVVKDIIRIDGLRLVFDNGWALIRASNTQPVLVLRFEAATEQELQEIKTFVETRLSKVLS
ncbi:MAG: phosphomannomutase/phosphoglucomutase [Deltaproteobacteria bacterium]|nr:phosphomannomutase/phosphoglucomutase [Deltaproteobacteria bacterium]